MPRMSGFDFAEHVWAARPDIPIVISSGYVRPEYQERAQRMGIHQLIQKPHTLEQLQQTLDRFFERSAVPAEQPPH
jgi:CheY-like chemotaxis protein